METDPGVSASFEAGREVEISALVARRNELEAVFDDQGYVYIAVNGWLISSLDGNPEARELMLLRAVCECLEEQEAEGRIVLADARDPDDGAWTFICRLEGRHVPDGFLYFAPSHDAETGQEAIPGARL